MDKKTDYIVKDTFSHGTIGSYEQGATARLTKEEAKKVNMFLKDYKEEKPEEEATPKRSASTKKTKEDTSKGVENVNQ